MQCIGSGHGRRRNKRDPSVRRVSERGRQDRQRGVSEGSKSVISTSWASTIAALMTYPVEASPEELCDRIESHSGGRSWKVIGTGRRIGDAGDLEDRRVAPLAELCTVERTKLLFEQEKKGQGELLGIRPSQAPCCPDVMDVLRTTPSANIISRGSAEQHQHRAQGRTTRFAPSPRCRVRCMQIKENKRTSSQSASMAGSQMHFQK
jgi:hypothetical protein